MFGLNQLSDRNSVNADVRDVDREYPNPNFSQYTLAHDLMLIKLSSPVSDDIPIIPYNTDSSVPEDGETVKTIGFGATEIGGTPLEQLQQVNLEIFDYGTCSDIYYNPFFGSSIDNDVMICAGGYDESKDACSGDSGGPLLSIDPDGGTGTLLGVVSFGLGCGNPGNLFDTKRSTAQCTQNLTLHHLNFRLL